MSFLFMFGDFCLFCCWVFEMCFSEVLKWLSLLRKLGFIIVWLFV